MKKVNKLLDKLENLSNTSDEISQLNEPYALQIKGGLLDPPANNGTCSGHNPTCNNMNCPGSTNDVCNGGCSA